MLIQKTSFFFIIRSIRLDMFLDLNNFIESKLK